MGFRVPHHWRRLAGQLAASATLLTAGGVLVIAAQMGWWATLVGAALVAGWVGLAGCWATLGAYAPTAVGATPPAADHAVPLHSLLDQVPLPLVRTDGGGAYAINRAARALFITDDRILPLPAALANGADHSFRHAGRSWRSESVDTVSGERLAVLIDVDAEERAAKGRAEDEMIDILGHELLNGLSPIVSLADSAVTAAAHGSTALPGILATLARRVEGLEGFTRAYRTLSRLPNPAIRPVPLEELTTDLARLFASRFAESVALTIDTVPGRIVQVDRDQMVQALWALLQNGAEAALAAPEPRRVQLMLADGPGLTIHIADTGAGIAAPDRGHILRPFFTTKADGSGIGLTLARRIIHAHGGRLQLLPTALTTFECNIPMA